MSEAVQMKLEGKKKECEHLVVQKSRFYFFGALLEEDDPKYECRVCGKRFSIKDYPKMKKRVGLPKNPRKAVEAWKWYYDNNVVLKGGFYKTELVLDFSQDDKKILEKINEFCKVYQPVNLEKRKFDTTKAGTEKLRSVIIEELKTNPQITPREFFDKYSKTHWYLNYQRVAYNFKKVID